jgi:hypothetical protein
MIGYRMTLSLPNVYSYHNYESILLFSGAFLLSPKLLYSRIGVLYGILRFCISLYCTQVLFSNTVQGAKLIIIHYYRSEEGCTGNVLR